ncbi:ATP-binding protein [Acinetobacter baumannii]|uniref:ATP-binding protein n=1 Tax=Acinetobacter baumannii TaxID=470 RepID=UPI002958BE42|nr:ATP-binding protein [Acinetobacter baumannii]WNX59151.1 ATP-binding protein [Acinetobacter baumannii]
MKPVNLKFDGKVIEELSTKIPSNIFALNELTKNSYDAFAKKVSISIDMRNSKLIISDDGKGMNEEDIRKLFHIANSTKKYGSKVTYKNMERYVQGSKGLGFLSVFKFGNVVSWETYRDGKKIVFSVDKRNLISKNNVSRFQFSPIITEEVGEGTKISIDMDESELKALNNYFQDEKNTTKTVNAFYDNTFHINLELISGVYETTDFINHLEEAEEDQFCAVEYSSESSKIYIYRLGELVETYDYKISSKNYSVALDLTIYHFNSRGKQKISKLFYREPDEALTPLLFINNNLFNNFSIFDSNINRAKRSGESMPQMTGYVRVYSSSGELDFNSDRTNFVENDLTRAIKEDLVNLNRRIQEIASNLKVKGKNEDTVVITGKARGLKTEKGKVSKPDLSVAKINLKNNLRRKYQIPSPQIELKSFISSVVNSLGEQVSVEDLLFLEKNRVIQSILPSVDVECIKDIKISFTDPQTGRVVENLKLEFFLSKATISGKSKKELFTLLSNSSYSVSIPYVTDLIKQASELYKSRNSKYYEIISCSLRAILELSCDYLQKDFPQIFQYKKPTDEISYKNDELLWRVSQVIFFLKQNKKLLTAVSQCLGMSYTSLNNFLDMSSYHSAVKNAHLGAHKSTSFITPDDVKSLAQRVGHFAVFCDALLYKIDEQIIQAIEIDFSSFIKN